MTPYHHALSSAKKFGGRPEDYTALHDWFDETKQYTGDFTHRALRHHSAGIQWAIEKVKLLGEQHVTEDCGYIPTIQDWLKPLSKNPDDWMLKVGKKRVEQELVLAN